MPRLGDVRKGLFVVFMSPHSNIEEFAPVAAFFVRASVSSLETFVGVLSDFPRDSR